MEYLEKAKYELILGLKNKEDANVLNVLQQYYNDVNNIVSKNYLLFNKKELKFVVMTIDNKISSYFKLYFFSDENQMNTFMDKYKDSQIISYNIIKEIDPVDDTNPISFTL